MPNTEAWRRFLPNLPPPAFCDPVDLVLDTLPSMRPQRRITVPEWAAGPGGRRMSSKTFDGVWSNDFAPYMTEPASAITSRKYGGVAFCGPARTAKSEALIINPIGHAIMCRPRETLVVCQTQDSAKQFSERKLGPLLRSNPVLRERQMTGRGADNIHEKRFAGGMDLQIRWPVIGYFSQNEYQTVLLTDYDRFPDDIDGEGDAWFLARKRTQHAGSLGMAVAESSPGRLVERDDWEPSTVHEAPPCGGILGIFNEGTRGKFYWRCPHCGDWFQPLMDTLQWDTRTTPNESARTVFMACPSGCVIAPDHKPALNRSGKWLHETNDGQDVCEFGDTAIRDADTASWWCEGPVAAMQSWQQLVARLLEARVEFETRGDETKLKATVNLDQGRPHVPMIRVVGEGLVAEALKQHSERFPMGVAPAETRFVTVQVDVNGAYFSVSVEAWGPELEHWMIDRFDITVAPTGEGKRAIDPARYSEDWDALLPLFGKAIPIADSGGLALIPRAIIVDSAGAAGVTGNAYKFYRTVRKLGLGKRFFLSKGRGGLDRQRAVYAAPEKVLGTRQKRRTDLRIVQLGTDLLKDEVGLALTRRHPGPNAFHLPEGLSDAHFAELCAEVRTEKGWEKRKGGLRNETLDLAVQARGLAIVLKAEKINWARPPAWAAVGLANPYVVRPDVTQPAVAAPVTDSSPSPDLAPVVEVKAEHKPRRAKPRVARSSFLSR